MAALLSVLKHKWLTPLKNPTESFAGKTIVVTGANSGIGLEAAAKFSALGAAKVILAVRDLTKGDTAKSAIETRTGKKDQIEVWQLDMSSYESIQSFADRAKSLDRLDVALLNAGVYRGSFHATKYGWEEDLQVNTISTILLALLLLPKLKETKKITGQPSVLEFTNSGLHGMIKVPQDKRNAANILEAYSSETAFNRADQYSLSKLFLMYATNKLAADTPPDEVVITSVCPGVVSSGLARDFTTPAAKPLIALGYAIFARTPEVGGRALVSGTTLGEQSHGRFWQHDKIQPLAPILVGEENEKLAQKVWKNLSDALSKDVPAVAGLL